MIINNLNIPGLVISPYKTNAPLIVDTNAALSFSIAAQRFQTITGRSAQIVQPYGRIKRKQLFTGAPL